MYVFVSRTGLLIDLFLLCDQSQETQRLLSEPGEFLIILKGLSYSVPDLVTGNCLFFWVLGVVRFYGVDLFIR